MKYLLAIIILVLPIKLFSQKDSVYLIYGEVIGCKITKVDSMGVHFKVKQGKNKVEKYISNDSILKLEFNETMFNNLGFNLSAGYGPSFGVIGTNVLYGKNNSGITMGLGLSPSGFLKPSIGVQAAYNWFFVNVGYGPCEEYENDNIPLQMFMGVYANIGGIINIGAQEKFFLQIGLGISAPNGKIGNISNITFENRKKFSGLIGFGYRFNND